MIVDFEIVCTPSFQVLDALLSAGLLFFNVYYKLQYSSNSTESKYS